MKHQHAYFSYVDEHYVKLIIDFLRSLEPRIEPEKQVLFNIMDEVNEVLLFKTGTYRIGFEI